MGSKSTMHITIIHTTILAEYLVDVGGLEVRHRGTCKAREQEAQFKKDEREHKVAQRQHQKKLALDKKSRKARLQLEPSIIDSDNEFHDSCPPSINKGRGLSKD